MNTARLQPAPIPLDETERLRALRNLRILDSEPSESYDRITRFVAKSLDMPIALVSLLDSNRQWFKSRVGLSATETSREVSFCAHVVFDQKPLIVSDATQDERFAGNPLVTDAPHVRAYIGVPLFSHRGYAIGTLCAIDNSRSRQFDQDDLDELRAYAKILEELIHAQELARVSEGALRFAADREMLFRDTFEQAAVGIIHVSPTGHLSRVNQRVCDLLGYSEAQLLATSFAAITHPEDLAESAERLRQMLRREVDQFSLETRLALNGGGYLWSEVSVALKRGSAGEPDYIIVAIADISARKKAEADLLELRDKLRTQVDEQTGKLQETNRILELQIEKVRESERATQAAMSQLKYFHYALDQHASLAVTDVNGVITYVNKKFNDISGYTSEEIVGKTLNIVKSGIHPPALFEDLWRTILSGEVWHGEICNRKKSGELYWVDMSIVPYKDQSGRIIQFVSIRLDVTEQKRDRELLLAEEVKSRQVNERLRQITDNMPAMIAYWDRDGICRFANQRHFDRFGLIPQQIVGMSLRELFGTSFEYKRPYIEAALRGERQLFDHSAAMHDGSLRHWHSDYVPHYQGERVIGFYALAVDITQQKQIEADLAHAQKLESIGQLSAGIAHEINTPTQFIGNNVGFLKDSITEIFSLVTLIVKISEGSRDGMVAAADLAGALATVDLSYLLDEVPKAVEQSLEGIDRIQKIVAAMKEFSHPATEKTLVDLNRAINSTIIVASNEWKYVAELKTDFQADLQPVLVMPGSFNQVILNMIVNAAHAVSEAADRKPADGRMKGVISVSTRGIDRWVEIRIKDSGCGIPEKIRDRIFDPFFTTKPVGKGTGQGLAIAHDVIVKKHGGAIAVESELDVGTTFILRLPMGEECSDAIAVA